MTEKLIDRKVRRILAAPVEWPAIDLEGRFITGLAPLNLRGSGEFFAPEAFKRTVQTVLAGKVTLLYRSTGEEGAEPIGSLANAVQTERGLSFSAPLAVIAPATAALETASRRRAALVLIAFHPVHWRMIESSGFQALIYDEVSLADITICAGSGSGLLSRLAGFIRGRP